MIPGLLYYVNDLMGFFYVIVGIGATLLYVPFWIGLQYWNKKHHPEIVCGINDV